MSQIKTIEDVERIARENNASAIGICVEMERLDRGDVCEFIPQLISRGHSASGPWLVCAFPMLYAFEYRCMNSLRILLELMPAEEVREYKDDDGNTIVHAAARSRCKEMVDLALSLCPEGLNYTNFSGETPLMYGATASNADLNPATRELIHRGCDMNTPCDYTLHRVAIPRQILDYLFEHCRSHTRNGLWKFCIAYGARPDGSRYASYTSDALKAGTIPLWYHTAVVAVEKCRSAAYTVLKLARSKGNVCGNGRDVLRLIAKEVWLSRMDDAWEK